MQVRFSVGNRQEEQVVYAQNVMKRWFLTWILVVGTPLAGFGQFGGFGDIPVEITSDGETRFEGGVAVAEDNVIIHYGDTSIFCDFAQYSPETRDVLLRGNVRLYRGEVVFRGERAVYNLETRELKAADFAGDFPPFYYRAENLSSRTLRKFTVRNASFTTHDSSKPDFNFKAKTVRIYPDNRVVFSNVTFYIGKMPVLWYPYLYQSLREDMSFTITPGYSSRWGGYLLTQATFPVTDSITGRVRLDLRSRRGIAGGIEAGYRHPVDDRTFARFRSYFISDRDPNYNKTGLARETVDSGRYRITYQQKAYVTDDIFIAADINWLSDSLVMEDFFPAEFRIDPQPDNVLWATKWHENYTLSLIARGQINNFQETTERLPEFVLDIKRHQLFGWPIFYEGETGVALLEKKHGDDVFFEDYDATRFDTFHQILYPNTYFGWLSAIPRIGFRGTYYSDTFTNSTEIDEEGETVEVQEFNGGSETRASFLAGLEMSFKVSKVFENVQSRAWGLDGMRHIFQPYTNFSYVSDPGSDRETIPQFDQLIPSTQLPPIDFPQFTAIDSIDAWTIWRLGMRNRLQTRRDDSTYNWLELDTFLDVNIDNPYDPTDLSNFFNRLTFRPLDWVSLTIDSQIPAFDDGFSEVNTWLRFMATRNFDFYIGHRYLNDNTFFDDSSLIRLGGYLRLGDHWGFSFYEQYEMEDSTLETQRYSIHRDLTSWVASLGAVIRDNRGGSDEYGLLLSFTLKDFPQLNLPISIDPGDTAE